MIAHESQVNRFQSGNYWNSFTFGTIGLSKKTEFAATLYGLGRPASGNNSLGVGLKHKIVDKEFHSGWHLESIAGFMVPFSLSGKGTGSWVYGAASIRTPKTKTRFTVGPGYGTRQIFGRRAYSTMVGVEQPLNKKWMLLADWFTGTNELGAAIAGFSWTPKPGLIIIGAYKVPNNAISGKPAPLIEVTYSFRAWK